MTTNITNTKTFLEALNLVTNTGFFDIIIPLFIVFAVSYALLKKSKILGDNDELNVILSFFLALVVSFVPAARDIILVMAPMFSVFGVILFLTLFLFLLFGISEKEIKESIKKPQGYLFLILMSLLIFFIALGSVIGSQLANVTSQPSPKEDMAVRIIMIIFDPRVLGTIILMLFFAFSIYFLTEK